MQRQHCRTHHARVLCTIHIAVAMASVPPWRRERSRSSHGRDSDWPLLGLWLAHSKDGELCELAPYGRSYVCIRRHRGRGLELIHYNGRYGSRTFHAATSSSSVHICITWDKYKQPLVRFTISILVIVVQAESLILHIIVGDPGAANKQIMMLPRVSSQLG